VHYLWHLKRKTLFRVKKGYPDAILNEALEDYIYLNLDKHHPHPLANKIIISLISYFIIPSEWI